MSLASWGAKPAEPTADRRVVKVGIIGCGLVTQTIHIPILNSLAHLFQITYLYDVSPSALSHSQSRIAGNVRPKTTHDIHDLCASPDVEVVLIASHHTFHAYHAVLALASGKHVFIEKPIALSLQDTDAIIAADEKAGGGKVMIGYMRRYAAAFVDAVREVSTLGPIRYARVRDIIGPNSVFVGQSGTFPRTFSDYAKRDSNALTDKAKADVRQALEVELGLEMSEESEVMWNTLSMLGSHDLSAMREILGMPEGVVGFVPCKLTGSPFWSAIFQYPDFVVAYESGVDQVARFDASIEVFGDTKTVKVCINTPFVRGLPTTMVIKETLPDGSYRESTVRRTYEDPFLLELQEMYEWVAEGKKIKTTPADARRDLEVLGMLMKTGFGVKK